MLSKALGSVVAEVVEVLSDTQVRIKREFGGEGGKSTQRIREKVDEAREAGKQGIDYKCLPFIDQQDMYRNVYQCLKEGGCIGIFPEGLLSELCSTPNPSDLYAQVVAMIGVIFSL